MPTVFKDILEKTTRKVTCVVVDENDAAIPAASLSTLTLTLYSLHTLAVVNSRNAQNALNANNVTVDANGVLTWEIQSADNQILDATRDVEIHRALFEWTWAGGAKAGKHEVDLHVKNLHKVV